MHDEEHFYARHHHCRDDCCRLRVVCPDDAVRHAYVHRRLAQVLALLQEQLAPEQARGVPRRPIEAG